MKSRKKPLKINVTESHFTLSNNLHELYRFFNTENSFLTIEKNNQRDWAMAHDFPCLTPSKKTFTFSLSTRYNLLPIKIEVTSVEKKEIKCWFASR
jgi:hypothetical protein